ncbi:DUF4406 domain-containing protein [Lacrimispora amygdalina]|uniref:DUF4406 domain-containing protein n=1 Tax=Lacrimispora amygdalina TaxID=253257 RepID=UPI000BE2FAD7|nr:DUF4406 domain-containing protein [Lacrimispora amygdalina]
MKKLFISQPMVDKTDEEILKEREIAVLEVKQLLNEEVVLIDSFCNEELTPLGYLAYSINCLSMADVAYFSKGWQDYRGCTIEYDCARKYGIKTILSEFDAHKTIVKKD